MGWRMPFIMVASWLSECAASLPFRLVWVQLFWGLQRFGYRPRKLMPWSEAAELGERIRRNGWRAYPKTERLFAEMRPAS